MERNIWESIARVRHSPMPGMPGWKGGEVDKEQFEKNMEQYRQNMDKLRQNLDRWREKWEGEKDGDKEQEK